MNTRYFTVSGTIAIDSNGSVSMISGSFSEVKPQPIPPVETPTETKA